MKKDQDHSPLVHVHAAVQYNLVCEMVNDNSYMKFCIVRKPAAACADAY